MNVDKIRYYYFFFDIFICEANAYFKPRRKKKKFRKVSFVNEYYQSISILVLINFATDCEIRKEN